MISNIMKLAVFVLLVAQVDCIMYHLPSAAGLGMLPSTYLPYQLRSRKPKRSSETRHATKTLTQARFQIDAIIQTYKLYDNMPTKAFDYMMLMVTLEAVFENTENPIFELTPEFEGTLKDEIRKHESDHNLPHDNYFATNNENYISAK